MSIPKVCGIETEYGISTRGFDVSPVTSSSMLVNAYAGNFRQKIGWDFLDENPSSDARGEQSLPSFPPEIETHLVNAVLSNGARYYVDHAHPEVSTPECISPTEAVVYDLAAEGIIRASMDAVNRLLPDGQEILTYKNNSDGKGNSYGCHENYLVARETPFGKLSAQITSHFVTRQVFCGAGKVGVENGDEGTPYQLSQRADFFEEEVGLETTLKRPIVNTRDEPHCDPLKYRRLHVIVGDANMSEVATFLKVGTTALVLATIEDDCFPRDLVIRRPVDEIRAVSHDVTLAHLVELQDGRRVTALNVQELLLEACTRFLANADADPTGGDGERVLQEWASVLSDLTHDIELAADRVDWVAKQRIVRGLAERHNLRAGDARLKAVDLQYHDMRVDKCLAFRAGLRSLVSESDVERAQTEPPDTTRAYFRGHCVQRWPDNIVAANWDSIVIDVGTDPLRRIPMMEPLKGTKVHVGSLLERVNTPAELIAELEGVELEPMYPDPGW